MFRIIIILLVPLLMYSSGAVAQNISFEYQRFNDSIRYDSVLEISTYETNGVAVQTDTTIQVMERTFDNTDSSYLISDKMIFYEKRNSDGTKVNYNPLLGVPLLLEISKNGEMIAISGLESYLDSLRASEIPKDVDSAKAELYNYIISEKVIRSKLERGWRMNYGLFFDETVEIGDTWHVEDTSIEGLEEFFVNETEISFLDSVTLDGNILVSVAYDFTANTEHADSLIFDALALNFGFDSEQKKQYKPAGNEVSGLAIRILDPSSLFEHSSRFYSTNKIVYELPGGEKLELTIRTLTFSHSWSKKR